MAAPNPPTLIDSAILEVTPTNTSCHAATNFSLLHVLLGSKVCFAWLQGINFPIMTPSNIGQYLDNLFCAN
jgi:hypothetical protein